MDIPDQEPSSIRSGDRIVWNKDLSADYSASDGWSLLYTLTLQSNAATRLQVTAATNGNAFVVTFTAAQTAALPAGTYHLFGHVSKALERYQVHHSTIELLPNLAAVTTGDLRSTVKRTLDALHAMVEGKATHDQQEVQINGRALTRYTPGELIVWLDKYKAYYAAELQKEKFAQTGIDPKNLGVRLVRI